MHQARYLPTEGALLHRNMACRPLRAGTPLAFVNVQGRAPATGEHLMKKMKLVMIGNGMAGVRTLEELLKIAPDLYDITVFGAEPHPNYSRILLARCWPVNKRSTRSF